MSHLRIVFRFPALVLALLLTGSALSQTADKGKEPRVVVGKVLTPIGSVLSRAPGATQFTILKKGDPVYSGDLLVALPGALIESKNGKVRLNMHADLNKRSVTPILESAVVLHANDKADLDFTLDRGRIDVEDRQDDGVTKITVRFFGEKWELSTGVRTTDIALELYGRWPRGLFFHTGDNPPEAPTEELWMVVIKGEVQFKHGNEQIHMQAPPGPALYHWDSVLGSAATPTKLEKAPDWADASLPSTPEARVRRQMINQFRQRYVAVGLDKAISEALESGDGAYRRGALILLGATDNLPRLIDALANKDHPDVRDSTIFVLRHWIGRAPGQDAKLSQALIDKKYTPVEAEHIMTLLHSFGDNELARPETYDWLIHELGDKHLAIRHLAHWHLERLCTDLDKKVPYNATGSKEEISAAIKKWKEIIPDGELPPKPKAKETPKKVEKTKKE